jgi:hypothetical protein
MANYSAGQWICAKQPSQPSRKNHSMSREKAMAKVCKPFTMAQVRYFDAAQIEDAWRWLEEPA